MMGTLGDGNSHALPVGRQSGPLLWRTARGLRKVRSASQMPWPSNATPGLLPKTNENVFSPENL